MCKAGKHQEWQLKPGLSGTGPAQPWGEGTATTFPAGAWACQSSTQQPHREDGGPGAPTREALTPAL